MERDKTETGGKRELEREREGVIDGKGAESKQEEMDHFDTDEERGQEHGGGERGMASPHKERQRVIAYFSPEVPS